MLPKNEPVKRDPTVGLKMFIFGSPNIGKTSFAATFPNALILTTDNNVSKFTCQSMRIKAWRHTASLSKMGITADECLVNQINSILTSKHTYETIVVEIGSHIQSMMREYSLAHLGVEHESDVGFAKGWDTVKEELSRPLIKLLTSDLNVIFITHDKSIDEIRNRQQVRVGSKPDMRDAYNNLISGLCHLTGHMTYKEVKIDGVRSRERVLMLQSKHDQEITGNKMGIHDEYMILEEGYQYEDICELIKNNNSAQMKKLKK